MEPLDLLRLIVTTIERLGLPYFVTGSMARHRGVRKEDQRSS